MERDSKYKMVEVLEGDCYDWNGEVDKFEKTRLTRIPTRSMVNRRLVREVPGLKRVCGTAIVPKVIAPEGAELIEVLKTGGRSFLLEDRVVLDLSMFGWGEEGELQEFGVEVKGAGSEDNLIEEKIENLSAGNRRYARLLKEINNPEQDENLELKLNIVRTQTSHRPVGGQNKNFAISSLEDSIKCLRGTSIIKIAPVFEVPFLPRSVAININALETYSSGTYRGRIAQEKRLMPSLVRGIHLDCVEPKKLKNLCMLLGQTGKQRENVYKKMLDDIAKYLEAIPLGARKRKKGYAWQRIGDIKLSYDNPKEYWLHDTSWYLSKDIVIAPSGIYFVDLESLNPAEECTEKNFGIRQEMYITNVFRDFSRILTAYRKGMMLCNPKKERSIMRHDQKPYTRPKASRPTEKMLKEMEMNVLKDIVRYCNRSPDLSISLNQKNRNIKVKISYPNLKDQETFLIPFNRLALRYMEVQDESLE